jgi:hypothetical protein
MKALGICIAAVALSCAGCANTVVTTDAQQAVLATQSPPTPTPSAPPSAVDPASPSRVPQTAQPKNAFTAANVTVDMLLDDPRGKAILARYAPGIAGTNQLAKLRGRTLEQLAGNPESGLTPALVEKIIAELNSGEGR